MRTSFTLLVITALVASVAFAQEDGEWAEVSDAGESSAGKKASPHFVVVAFSRRVEAGEVETCRRNETVCLQWCH